MSVIIFDTETTGLTNAEPCSLDLQPKIIEIAAVKLDDSLRLIDKFEILLDPKINLSKRITQITGLKDEDVQGKPLFINVLPKLQDFFLGARTVVAHNLKFDLDMLRFELMRHDLVTKFPWPYRQICTVEATFGIKGHRMSLKDLYEYCFDKTVESTHRAMADVETLTECYRHLMANDFVDA